MKKLGMLLGRSSRKERRFLFLSYILNVFFISTVLMLVCELWSSSVNLSGPDAAQSEMIATAVILVAVIVIAFFLWLISMELKGLYESRMQFNTNVRLMGISNGNLMKLYLQEMLSMQPVCMVIGCVLGEIVYHMYALSANVTLEWIFPWLLIVAALIHLGMLLLTVSLIGLRQGSGSIGSALRGARRHRSKKLPGVMVQAVIAAALLIVIGLACSAFRDTCSPMDAMTNCQTVKMLYFAVVIFAFDPVMLLAFWIADKAGKKAGTYHFCFSLKLLKSFWGRFKIMCFLLIFSGSLICGLYSEFRSVRNMAGSMAEENIHYQRYDIYDGVMERKADGSEDTGGRFETFRYRALWEEQGSKIHIWITGVNAVYLTQYETVLADISDEKTASRMMTEEGKPEAFDQDGQLMELLEDENFDGILMPDGYASPGENIILNVDGAEIPFTVYGGCLSNDFDRLDAYVSRAYLEKQLGREGACNTVYYLEGAREAAPGSPAMSQTKEDVWQETWRHAVQGTENVELLIWMILICCILAVCTCLVMSCSDNRRMLACLQGMGTSRRVLVKISNLQAAWNVLCVVLPVIGLTYVLTRAVCYLTMGAAYAIVTPIEVSPSRFVLLFAAWFAIYLAVQLFLVRRETKDGRCVEILRK